MEWSNSYKVKMCFCCHQETFESDIEEVKLFFNTWELCLSCASEFWKDQNIFAEKWFKTQSVCHIKDHGCKKLTK